MKRFILTLFATISLCVFTSCDSEEYTYTLGYEIYWNNNFVEHKIIISNYPISFQSYKGTNTIYTDEKGIIVETTAPIRKVSYTRRKKDECS